MSSIFLISASAEKGVDAELASRRYELEVLILIWLCRESGVNERLSKPFVCIGIV